MLHGPLNGKSQTITNLIAHARDGEERALRLEKYAALNVVHERLKKWIGPLLPGVALQQEPQGAGDWHL